jgi:hypothetical protein
MGTLSFVDPAGGGRDMLDITGLDPTDDSIMTNYQVSGMNTEILGVISESPIPEPETWLLFGIGWAALAGMTRLRHRRVARAEAV